jgi:DNA-binding MarR family transcriptional regulator
LLYIQHTAMNETETKEIAQKIADECLIGRMRFINRVMTGLYERALKPFDIKTSQVAILVLLSIRGESSPSDIGRTLQMEKSTISRNIGRMRKKGWLEITAVNDRASQVIKATPKGRDLIGAVHAEWTRAQEVAGKLLGKEGVTAVHVLYDVLSRR